MKKLFTLIAAALLSTAAMADGTTTIGATDNTTPWWTVFSDWYTIAPNKTLTLTFVNHSSKGANYNNWASEIVSAESNYEWLLMRADCFGVSNGGWAADGMNTNNNTTGWFNCNYNNYDWNYDGQSGDARFRDNLDGATVKMTVQRNGDFLTLIEDVTTADGTGKYRHYFSMNCIADNAVDLKLRLTVDHAHIVVNNDYEYADTNVPAVEGTVVGALDNSTGWWTAFSEDYVLEPNATKTLKFKNYSSKTLNWHSFVAYITNDVDRQAAGYTEYYGFRLDNWMLVAEKNADACNYGEFNWDWELLREKWDGALVTLTVTRNGASVKTRADIAPADGSDALYEEYTQECGDGTQKLRLFLTAEGAHIDILPDNYTAIESVKAAKTAEAGVRYNLAGQKVGNGFKGVVIENGKKLVVK